MTSSNSSRWLEDELTETEQFKERYKITLLYLSLRSIYQNRNGNFSVNWNKVRTLKSETKRINWKKVQKEDAIKEIKDYYYQIFKLWKTGTALSLYNLILEEYNKEKETLEIKIKSNQQLQELEGNTESTTFWKNQIKGKQDRDEKQIGTHKLRIEAIKELLLIDPEESNESLPRS